MDSKRKIIKIDLVGKNDDLFKKIRNLLIDSIDKFLSSSIDYQTKSTVKDEVKKFASLAIKYGEDKLKKAGLENDKLAAEIEEKLAIAEKTKAETRKINAETRKLEFENSVNEFRFKLRMAKLLLVGNAGEEAIVYTKQLDMFIEVLDQFSNEFEL